MPLLDVGVSFAIIQIDASVNEAVIGPDDDAINDADVPVIVCDSGIDILPVIESGVAPFTVLTDAVKLVPFTVIPNPRNVTNDAVVACDAFNAYDALNAYDELKAYDAVPNKLPVIEPVNIFNVPDIIWVPPVLPVVMKLPRLPVATVILNVPPLPLVN
jgi:hypothetical protein